MTAQLSSDQTVDQPKDTKTYSRFLLYSHIGLASSAVFTLTTIIFNVVDLYRRQWWFISDPQGLDDNLLLDELTGRHAHGNGVFGKLSPSNKLVKLNLAVLSFVAISAGSTALLAFFVYYDKLIIQLFKAGMWINVGCLLVTLGLAGVIQHYYDSPNTTYTFKNHPPVTGRLYSPRFTYSNNVFILIFSIWGLLSTGYLLYRIMQVKHMKLVD